MQGLKDMGSGAMEYAGNKAKSLGNAATTGIRAVGSGIGAGLTGGGLRGAADAMDSTYNAGMAKVNQQSAAADAGWDKMNAGGARAGQQIENATNGVSEFVGNSVSRPSTAGIGLRSVGSAIGAGLSGGGLRGAADAMDSTWNAGKAQQAQVQGAADAGWNKMVNNGGATNPNDPEMGNRIAQGLRGVGSVVNPLPAVGAAFGALGSQAGAAQATSAPTVGVTPPVAAPAPAAVAPPPAAPVQPAAPTPGQLQQFQGGTATPYNAQSPLDKAKMQGLMGGQQNWSDNAWARGQMGKSGSAFAMLEKGAAGGLAGAAIKGLKGLGSKLYSSGRAAGSAARNAAKSPQVDDAGQALLNLDGPNPASAYLTSGRHRRRAGVRLGGAADAIEGSAGAQKAINYGGGGLLAGGALLGSNRLGHASGTTEGRASGVAEGFDNGTQVGMASAQSAMQDPGIMGRIADVFTGASGPDMGKAQQQITNNRDSLIQSILAGR